VIRVGLLLAFILVGRAQAQPSGMEPYDPQRVTAVYAEALAFMAPRILDPVPISQLTVWGLRGLTALDPALSAGMVDGRLQLATQTRVLFEMPAPKDETPFAWASAAAVMAGAGIGVSAPIRRAGTQGVIQSFFDEMFNHLDPYSRYVGPDQANEDRANRAGVAGLGVSLIRRGRAIVVQSVIRDGPASIAGIRPGDVILTVDGQSAYGQDARTVTELLAGPEDSILHLVWRGHDGKVRDARLSRALVPPETVFSERVGDVLVVRITGFSTTTDGHLAHTLQDGLAGAQPIAGIVLDLRGNRGGLLRKAVTVADTFLPAGIVARTAGRDPDSNHVWRSTAGELAEGVPVVVLVDGRSASSAEILAAALSDRGRAVVVGSATLGKGLVQTIDPLPDGGELFVTWSRVLAPRGWPIQSLGVLPQVCTSRGHDALRRQLAALAAGIQPMAASLAMHEEARAPLTPAQVLAIRNACPAAGAREYDLGAARTLIRNPAAYAAALFPPMASQP